MGVLFIRLKDGEYANVSHITIKNFYGGVLEAVPGAFTHVTNSMYLPSIHRHISDIGSGKIKGRYCPEPELMDELDLWNGNININPDKISRCGKCMKEYEVEAKLEISQQEGQYNIILECYFSTKEIASTPLVELLRGVASNLSFADLEGHCNFIDWDEL